MRFENLPKVKLGAITLRRPTRGTPRLVWIQADIFLSWWDLDATVRGHKAQLLKAVRSCAFPLPVAGPGE